MIDNSLRLQKLGYLTDSQKSRLSNDLDLDSEPDTDTVLLVLDTILNRLLSRRLSDLTPEERLQVLYAFRDCRVYCREVAVPCR
jgi:hypothetical protein